VREEQILLGFIEPVNLINEKDGLPVVYLLLLSRLINGGSHILDTRRYRGDVNEMGLRISSYQPSQGGLTASRRPPEDKRL
jgi:hypothetical protein